MNQDQHKICNDILDYQSFEYHQILLFQNTLLYVNKKKFKLEHWITLESDVSNLSFVIYWRQ